MANPVNLHSHDVSADLKAVVAQDPENQSCFECNANHPTWASVSLGIMLCLNCAGKHRGLGTHLSTVRSLTLDNWQPKHIEFMKLGGNGRAKRALEPVLEMHDLRSKYESPEAETHRTSLKADVHQSLGLPLDEPLPNPPSSYRTLSGITNSQQGSSDWRNNGATSISSHQFHNNRPPPRHPDETSCPCTIL